MQVRRDRVTGPTDRDDDVMRAVVVEQLAAEADEVPPIERADAAE